jgi:hypothetical protein
MLPWITEPKEGDGNIEQWSIDTSAKLIVTRQILEGWGRYLLSLASSLEGSTWTVPSNLSVPGTLSVTGATTLTTLTTSGAATLDSAAVTNALTVGTTLDVTGASTLAGVTGTTLSFTSTGHFGGNLDTDGTLTVDTTSTLTGNVTLGGTIGWGATSSDPILKRSTTDVYVRLGDDSDFTNLQAEDITANGDLTVVGAFSPTNLTLGAAGILGWTGRSEITAPADGQLLLTVDAGAGAGGMLLQFGNTTSGAPALKRNSAELQVRTADDGGFADFQGGGITGATLTSNAGLTCVNAEIDGDLNHDGLNVGFRGTAPIAVPSSYTITNYTADRAIDCDATSEAELRDFVATIAKDLIDHGLLAGSVT